MPDSDDLYRPNNDTGPRLIAYLSRYLFWLTVAILLAGFSFVV